MSDFNVYESLYLVRMLQDQLDSIHLKLIDLERSGATPEARTRFNALFAEFRMLTGQLQHAVTGGKQPAAPAVVPAAPIAPVAAAPVKAAVAPAPVQQAKPADAQVHAPVLAGPATGAPVAAQQLQNPACRLKRAKYPCIVKNLATQAKFAGSVKVLSIIPKDTDKYNAECEVSFECNGTTFSTKVTATYALRAPNVLHSVFDLAGNDSEELKFSFVVNGI